MLSKLSIRSKLAIVAVVPLLALALVALIGWRLISSSTIGSKPYEQIQEANDLVADILPPPAYLIEPHLAAEELASAESPAVAAELIQELRDARGPYEARQQYWLEALSDEPEQLAQLIKAYDAGIIWYDSVLNQLVPAVESGDMVAAGRLDDQVLNGLFDNHRAEIAKLVTIAEEREATVETGAKDSAQRNTLLTLATLVLLAALSTAIAVLVSRAIGRPIRQLTAAARKAETDLPAMLASINTAEELPAPEPLVIDSKDELGELAVALNSMQSAAVGLAADQARSRRNVSTMLANLARRNQGLLNRTLAFITRLEENERDPEALDNLFKLDHLTTRMRRNAESLLVLAGSEAPRTWAQPIEVGNVIRAAMSEIEAFDRVEVASMDPVMVRGNAVSDVAHLLAELLDNATRFSPPTTTVSIVGKDTADGYVISIIDQGMGMTPEQLESANRDIETVGRFEEGSTMVLGLAVVGRLAARNSVAVRLSESPFEGVTAQVRLPGELLERRNSAPAAMPAETQVELEEVPVVAVSTMSMNGSSAYVNGSSTAVMDTPTALVSRHLEPVEFPPPSFTPPTSTAAADLGIEAPPVPGSEGWSAWGAASTKASAPVDTSMSSEGSMSFERSYGNSTPAASPAFDTPAYESPMSYETAAPVAEAPVAEAPVADENPMSTVQASVTPVEHVAAPSNGGGSSLADQMAANGGLARRVPGANLFESNLPDAGPTPDIDRSAEDIRDALSSFQQGFQNAPKGTEAE